MNYEHDCESCRSLGSTDYKGKPVDLYVCGKQGEGLPTLIARWSSEPQDYSSGLESAAICMATKGYQDYPLAQALRRAVALASKSPKP